MAAIDRVTVSDLGPGLGGWGDSLDDVLRRALDQAKVQGWRWYEENEDRVLYARKLLFWTVSIRVHDLRFVFEELFGEQPA